MRTHLVVAGNSWGFRDWVSGRPESERPHYKEVKVVHNLYGWENVEVDFVGAWRNREDAERIESKVLERKEMGKVLVIHYWT